MSADTDRLIAQARATTPPGSFAWQLADALDAAEAAREDCVTEGIRVLQRAEAAEAQRDTLRTALDWIEAQPEDSVKVQLWARAALAVVAPPEAET